jgi:hypothetical protein
VLYRACVKSDDVQRGPGPRALWWFLIPLLSAGYLTFLVVFHAALVLRSRATLVAAAAYLALDIGFVVEADVVQVNGLTVAIFMIVSWVGGTVHAAQLTSRYRDRMRPTAAARPWTPLDPEDRTDDAMVAAQMAIARRRESRRIVEEDVPLAAELRIGRPDLHRTYDDGGLIDVNHVPVEYLISELEMHPATADEVIVMRSVRSGFTSADDMLIACDSLNPARMDMLRDRLIFLPRDIDPEPIAERLRRRSLH